MNNILSSLHLNTDRIRSNLYLRNGAQCAENLMIKLTDKIGRQKAHELLKGLSSQENFIDVVKKNEIVSSYFSEKELDEILDPMNYLGLSQKIVEKLLDSI
jgi:adenylosuccinate lyase